MYRVNRLKWLLGIVFGMTMAASVMAQSADDKADTDKSSQSSSAPSENQSEAETRPFISTGLSSESLAQQFPDQSVWLDTGANGQVLGLLQLETVSPAKGAVLVLADEGQTADTGLVGALRQPLAASGWATMTLGLEPPPYPVVRARSQPIQNQPMQSQPEAAPQNKGGDPSSKPAGEAPPTETAESDSIMIDVMDKADLDQLRQDYRDKLDSQIGAAFSHLRGQGYQRVALVGVGYGAAPMARFALGGGGQGELQALVWVAPEVEPSELEALAGAKPANLRLLDLRSGRAVDESANARQATLRRAGLRGYDQQRVAMAARPKAQDARQVSSRISAWLRRLFFSER